MLFTVKTAVTWKAREADPSGADRGERSPMAGECVWGAGERRTWDTNLQMDLESALLVSWGHTRELLHAVMF